MSDKIIPLRFIDRTRTVTDWKCKRSRYWGYEHDGRGLSKSTTSIELFMGITIHDALAAIATFHKEGVEVPIDDIASTAFKQMYENLISGHENDYDSVDYANEQATLVEGLLRGFHKHTWPRLMAAYPTIVAIETEMNYPLGEGYVFMTKPDLVVADEDDELTYIEYKSTSSKKEAWINSWDTAVQLHSSAKATALTLGRNVEAVQIVGLYKGYESYGKQSSPFCYAYKKFGSPPFTQDQVSYEFKPGFKRSAVWQMEGGVAAWVNSMPDNVLATQFPMTPRIFVNDDLVEGFFRQRLEREKEIAAAVKDKDVLNDTATMDRVFPQSFDQCVPSFGWSCQFKKLCHGYVAEPLSEGFALREPHHDQEREQLGL